MSKIKFKVGTKKENDIIGIFYETPDCNCHNNSYANFTDGTQTTCSTNVPTYVDAGSYDYRLAAQFEQGTDLSLEDCKGYWMAGEKQTVDIFDEDESWQITNDEFQTYKPRKDLENFPNAKDPELPYVFDLLYDIKWASRLREEIEYLEKRLNGLKELIEEYGVKL